MNQDEHTTITIVIRKQQVTGHGATCAHPGCGHACRGELAQGWMLVSTEDNRSERGWSAMTYLCSEHARAFEAQLMKLSDPDA